jgi:hypothetical protein
MEESKSGLYIVAIVGIVAVVAIIILVSGGNKASIATGTAANPIGRAYELGACHYEDGSSSGCPCTDPSDGILSSGSPLIETDCK